MRMFIDIRPCRVHIYAAECIIIHACVVGVGVRGRNNRPLGRTRPTPLLVEGVPATPSLITGWQILDIL